MNLSTSTLHKENQSNWNKSNWLSVAYSNTKVKDNSFNTIYIGKNNRLRSSIGLGSSNTVTVSKYSDATEYLESVSNVSIKQHAIFIDLPLTVSELENFNLYLKSNKKYSKIPVFYNSTCLQQNMPLFLKHLGLIDSFFDFSNHQFNIRQMTMGTYKEKRKIEWLNVKDIRTGIRNKDGLRTFSFELKKFFDMFIALLIILTLLPLFILIAIAIRLESKGPIFYSSPRAGRGYKIFKFYKFRSMVVDADKKIKDLAHLNQYNVNDKGPAFFKLSNDPRVTKVGKFLRNTSLDEIPQLFNVLKGDMSLVGNRPLPLYEAETLTTNQFVERFSAPAGMTGLWQVKKRGKADMSTEERMELDIIYARKASPLFDLYLLLLTPIALFQKSDV